MKTTEDLTGRRFGRWIVIKRIVNNKYGHPRWLCKCECGEIRPVLSANLLKGKSKSCSCLQREIASNSHYRRFDFTGKTFGSLIAIRYKDTLRGRVRWLCRCKCGKECFIFADILPRAKSCGCLRYWKGKDNPNWQGGITPKSIAIRMSIEYRLWREAVFARDNWTCETCKEKGGRLNAHHIKSFSKFPELRFAIDNGQTLCRKCHRKIHKGKRI